VRLFKNTIKLLLPMRGVFGKPGTMNGDRFLTLIGGDERGGKSGRYCVKE
jgi:hypothetical protein